jgi:hypothetical protein
VSVRGREKEIEREGRERVCENVRRIKRGQVRERERERERERIREVKSVIQIKKVKLLTIYIYERMSEGERGRHRGHVYRDKGVVESVRGREREYNIGRDCDIYK